MTPRLAVVSALSEEIRPLLRRLEGRRRVAAGIVEGRLAGRDVIVAATGDGAAAARRGVARVLDAGPASAVLGLGFAGGLAPSLEVGRLVVGAEVLGEGGRRSAHPAWARDAAQALQVPRGLLLTARNIVPTPAAKAALHGRHDALTVDLESAVWAAAAEEAGIPWLVLRVVFDTADDEVPSYVMDALDEDGRVRRGRLILGALSRPGRLRGLLRLGKASSRLAGALAGAAETVVGLAPR